MSVYFKCDVCGRFISYRDIESGKARHRLITPDSHLTSEEWETTCREHTDVAISTGVGRENG